MPCNRKLTFIDLRIHIQTDCEICNDVLYANNASLFI